MHSILAIGGDNTLLSSIGKILTDRGHLTHLSGSAEQGLAVHRDEGADVLVLSLPLGEMSGVAMLRRLRAQDPRAVIVVTGQDDSLPGAPEALAAGAFDYLADPVGDANALLFVIGIGLGARRGDHQLRYLRRKDAADADWQTIVGDCPQMRKVFGTVRQICHRTLGGGTPAILVTGETGTGKGLIAKAIHYNSGRRSRAFVEVNCAAIAPTLIEDELFGHTRGAFTDARSSRAGLFETADEGSLFLDEISTLPLELQGKLLTAIEEKTIRRLGASEGSHVDVQIIAATHRDLPFMIERGEFRADLFHRINVLSIELPPLRDRGSDRAALARAFVAAMCREYGISEKLLTEDALAAIERHRWPGNVRELRNQIERIVLLSDDDRIRARDFQFAPTSPTVQIQHGSDGLCIELPDDSCPLVELEREVIRKSLAKHQGNVSHTARYLGITRHTLIYRIKKHGLGDPKVAVG